MKMDMNLRSFANKSFNRKDTKLAHRKIFKSFIHSPQYLNQKSDTNFFLLGKWQTVITRGEKDRTKDNEKETIIDPTIMLLETLLINIQGRNFCLTNSTLLCSSPSYECPVHALLVL